MKKLLLLGCLACSIFGYAQELESKLEINKIKIGEPARLTFSVDYKKGDKIIGPDLKDSLTHHIEILNHTIDTLVEGEQKKIIHHLDLTSFDAGEFLVRTIEIEKNGEKLKTKPFQLEVQDVEVDTAQAKIQPIKPVMTEEYSWKDYWNRYWIYGIAALILFIIALVLVVLYIRSKSKNLKNAAPKTPYEEMLAGLKSLDAKKYLKRNEQKEYYTQLSFILRRYIGKVYQFSALEVLSDDLIQYIQQKEDVLTEDKHKLKAFLFDADLVKFAKHELPEEKHQDYRQWIAEFVERIKPLDIPVEDLATEDSVTGEKYKKWDNS
ncbi:hypothetical protein [Faecalibacter sp. LW9]|uniref:hypothetical protein n=1 Tax=Faecalibacter sp. LW9 TaxID=3103144 RepID=UPI002AFEC47B|nr:hypothetical protein [Faecalibacter sp. LW9]